MTRMNSSRSFRLALVVVALVLSAGAAGAVTISNHDTPEDAAVGDRLSTTYVFADLYQNPQYEQWTLQGETELGSVTWTVQLVDQVGNVRNQNSYDGAVFNQSVSARDNVDEVRVQLTGTVPEVGNWSYRGGQAFLFAEYRLTRQGGTSTVINTFRSTRYTEGSREARRAIESARGTIEDAGGNQQAERTLENAVSAYNAGNFDNAADLAGQAQETAKSAKQRGQTIQLALYAIVGLIVVGGVIGGVYWYRSGQTQSKL